MQLLLIRHGRPERIDHDPNGANPRLTDLGHRQAAAMAEYLAPEKIDAVYVSPQQRAIDTAAPLAKMHGHTPTVVHGIAEFDLGHISYIPGDERGEITDEEVLEIRTQLTAEAFRIRVLDSVSSIMDSHPGETVAAVCHGGVISTVMNHVLKLDGSKYFDSQYTSVTRIRKSDRWGLSLTSFNECHWLRHF